MKVYLNDKEFEITLEKETTLYEVVKPIEEWCNRSGLLISEFSINNNDMTFDIVEKEDLNIDVNEVKDLHIYALTYSEYAMSSLASIVEYIEKISDIVPETLTIKTALDISNGLMWIIDSLPRTIYLLKMNIEDLSVMHIIKMLEVKKERIEALVKEGNDKNIKDFFANDFKPFLKDKVIVKMNNLKIDSEINTLLSLSANINKNNSLYSIGSVDKYILLMISMLDNITLFLQTGNDKEAFALLEKFSSGISAISKIIHTSTSLHSINMRDIVLDNLDLSSLINIFNTSMKNVLESFANEDYVSVSDILSYEVKEQLESLVKYPALIEATIERKNA